MAAVDIFMFGLGGVTGVTNCEKIRRCQFPGDELRDELEQRVVDRTTIRPGQHAADPGF
jgi:hypothetical protein